MGTETVGRSQLHKEISSALNVACAENASNTPDFILAEFMLSCLDAYNGASNAREKWYGKHLSIGDTKPAKRTVDDFPVEGEIRTTGGGSIETPIPFKD